MPIILESPAASGGGGSGTVTNVSSANTGIAVANPTTTPTLTLATLDVIAADGPPAANWSNNSKKITSLANGAAAQDAAAFGQIPTALPPNGAAGGDLAGTYPNPAVKAITETSGPTDLVIGAIADGQVLKRVGGTLVSVAAGAGTVTNVSSPNTSIVVTNPTTTPALAVGTLDVLAANGPAAANWSNNSHKITAVTPGASAGETATYEQTPASILTTKADVIVASAANTPARLAVGTQPGAALIADTQATNGVAYRRPISYDASVPGAGNSYQTYERQYGAANTGVLVSQQVFLFAVNLPSGFVATSITFVSATTPLGGGNHQLFGLYDDAAGSSGGSAYALLRGTSDDTSTAWGANTAKTLNLTSTYTTIRAGYFYLGILVDATTVPTLYTSAAVGSGLRALTPVAQGSSSTGRTTLPDPAAAPTATVNMTYAYVTGT